MHVENVIGCGSYAIRELDRVFGGFGVPRKCKILFCLRT